jgi:LPS O-antigen subunit length determinant protein (WzzB/FepE family)
MKKNNTYLADDEIDLANFIKSLWRNKILILSISIICGLAGYLYGSFQTQELKTEIQLRNPPIQLFDRYIIFLDNSSNIKKDNIEEFMSDFRMNFLSLDNLQSFTKESKEFDNLKAYLELRNISAKIYFYGKIGEAKEKNGIIPNKFFLHFPKELDGETFLNNYVEFIKNKTILDFKIKLKFLIENKIIVYKNSLEKAKLINLENPILRSPSPNLLVVNEPDDLFYKGIKILTQDIINFKKILTELENEHINFEIILDKAYNSPVNSSMPRSSYFAIGFLLGLFLSLGIIFFKAINEFNGK